MSARALLCAGLVALATAGCSEDARVEAVQVVDDGMALRIYVLGTPARQNDHLEVREYDREVRIEARLNVPLGGSDDGPAVVWCSEIGLDRPLGDRRIVDDHTGREIRGDGRRLDCYDDERD